MQKLGKHVLQLTPIEMQTMAYALNELLIAWQSYRLKTKAPKLSQSEIHAQRMLNVLSKSL